MLINVLSMFLRRYYQFFVAFFVKIKLQLLPTKLATFPK